MHKITARTINERLVQEDREAQLTRERDIADAVTHLEELYLAFPSISLEEISRTVLDEARRLTGSRFGFAGYINPTTGWLSVPASAGEARKGGPQSAKELVFKEFTGLWGWVLKKKKPLFTNSAASDPRAKGVPPWHIKIERFAAAPAVSGKKLIGILALANPPGDYPAAAMDAVKKLARVYALMLRHKLAEAGSLEQAALLKAQQEASPDAILVVDKNGRIRSFNRRFTEMWGLPPKIMATGSDEAALRAVREKLTDPLVFLERVRYLYAHPREKSRDEIPLKDGRTLDRYSTSVIGEDGRTYGRIWHFHDITERKRLRNILLESEEKYRALFETSRDALMILEPPDWKFSQANKATLKMFGAQEEADFLKLTPWAISPKKQPDGSVSAGKAKEMMELALKTGSHYFEWEHKCLYGPVFSAEVLLTRVDIGGKQVIQACIRDISARKRMEELLRQSELRQHLAMSQINGVLWVLDRTLRFTLSRGQGLAAMGLKPDQVKGMTLEEFMRPAGPDSPSLSAHRRALQGRNVSYEEKVNNMEFSIFLSPLRDQDDKIAGVVGIALDITEKKRMERLLKENEETLRKMETELALTRAAEAVSRVTRPMAHDFNNALAAINGYATLIDDDLAASSPIKTEISRIIEAVRRAAVVTSKLQDFARNPKIKNPGETGEKKEGD